MLDHDSSTSIDVQTFTVTAADEGLRLARFLAQRLSLSLSQVNRLFDQGKVQCDRLTARRKHKGMKLTMGQVIRVEPFERPSEATAAPNDALPLDVLAVDESAGWVVVNKPAGAAVHPLDAHETGTVLNAVTARYPQVQGVGEGGLRSGVVHRLDRETSGVLAFALNDDAWRRLRDAFRQHTTRKTYHAIALGQLRGEGEENMHLYVAQHRPAMVRVAEHDPPRESRLCDLRWKALDTFTDATLVEVQLGTGFLHQIRVMMAHLGHPVAGDAHYRPEGMADPTGAPRIMLHAARLIADEIDATAPRPDDFVRLLDRLRG